MVASIPFFPEEKEELDKKISDDGESEENFRILVNGFSMIFLMFVIKQYFYITLRVILTHALRGRLGKNDFIGMRCSRCREEKERERERERGQG